MSIAIIPARGGSVRIPRKNIRLFHGKPIMAYSIEAAQAAGVFDEVIVSTDDAEIAEVAQHYGASVWRRPTDDGSRGTQEVAADILKTVRHVEQACVIYPTAPMLDPLTLRAAAIRLVANPSIQFIVPCATWLRDPGQFYFGQARAFGKLPLECATLMKIDPATECDINTIDDWNKAEEMFAALYPEGK
jgi:pseudaminic acid cytidylyltransferase